MKVNRRLFFRIHSWIGVKLSILFFVICFSGTMATLSSEMDWLFLPESRATPQGHYASRNLIVQNLREAYPDGQIEYWTALEVPYMCDVIYVKEQDQRFYAFANPYTGEIQGHAQITFRRFFRDLHYFLFIPFQIGHFTVLIFGFLLLFSLVTALVFFKEWYKKLFDVKKGKGAMVFFRSVHRVVGIWSVPFLLLFSITGIWYFLERTNTGNISTTANPSATKIDPSLSDSTLFETLSVNLDYDRAVQIAQEKIAGLQVKTISPPSSMDGSIYLTGQSDVPLVRFRANRIYLHPQTYEVLTVQRADEIPAVSWLNDIVDPLHFGFWGGLITKVIWFLAGLSISSLILTGIWISLKRKVRNEIQRKRQRMGRWKYVNWTILGLMILMMYVFLIGRYHVAMHVLILVTTFWIISAGLAWYIFDVRLKEQVKKELASLS
ncbi:MAG: PepSY-associated TM helix domain-containing protein [Bacteroidota bacterium]